MGDERYEAPIRANTDNGREWSGSMDDMHRLLDATHPDKVSTAGDVYNAVSEKFKNVAGALRVQASALAGAWKGDDAEAALKQLEKLQRSADNIYQVAGRTGWVLKDHGGKLLWYQTHQPREGFVKGLTWDQAGVVTGASMLGGGNPIAGLIGLHRAEAEGLIKHTESKAAVEHVQRLSGRARESNSAMPPTITTYLPQSRVSGGIPPNQPPGGGFPGGGLPGGGGGVPGGGGSLPGGGGGFPGGGDGGVPGGGLPGGGFPGGGVPGGTGGGSDLAGLPPGGGGGGVDPFGKGGLPGGGLPSGGGGGGGIPGGGGGMAGGLPGGLPGTGAGAGKGGVGGGRGLGKAGSSGRGGMGAPMGGRGGGGKGEDEHERTTWLTEDEDVWGGNDDDTTPPVIG